MSETIRLPKSGKTLRLVTTFEDGAKRWEFLGVVGAFKSAADEWDVWGVDDSAASISRDEAIAWLDAHILALRADILPPGTVAIRDDKETRERIARAAASAMPPRFGSEADRETDAAVADAVLAALGVSK